MTKLIQISFLLFICNTAFSNFEVSNATSTTLECNTDWIYEDYGSGGLHHRYFKVYSVQENAGKKWLNVTQIHSRFLTPLSDSYYEISSYEQSPNGDTLLDAKSVDGPWSLKMTFLKSENFMRGSLSFASSSLEKNTINMRCTGKL